MSRSVEPQTVRVGFVGLGQMGLPMVERLRAANYPVMFYARRSEAIDAGSQLGAQPAASVKDMADKVDVMILCVYSDEQVRELTLGPDGIADKLGCGATLVIHTTGSPRTMEDIAAVAATRGANVLDAPVSGGPHSIKAGALTLFVGGDQEVLERCKPVLASYAQSVLHLGPLGAGQRTKLLNNLMFGAQLTLVAEASRLLMEFGMDPAAAFEAISHGSGDSAALRLALQSGSVEVLLEAAGRFITKDIVTAEAVTGELGFDTGLLGRTAAALYPKYEAGNRAISPEYSSSEPLVSGELLQ